VITLGQHNLEFGSDVSEWGDQSAAEMAADHLRRWVRTLDARETEDLRRVLVESDQSYGDDPIWDVPEMTNLIAAQDRARNAGLVASAAPSLNKNHNCICRLLPLPFES
jgi:hypothetical protein